MKRLILSILLIVNASAFAGEKTGQNNSDMPTKAVEALAKGTEYVLYSLDPSPLTLNPGPPPKPEESLDGFKIMGRLPLSNSASRAAAVEAVTKLIQDTDYHFLQSCFFPRHALRVLAGGKTFDFVICYQCGGMELFENGVKVVRLGIPSTPEPLNKLLSAAGIPMATPYPDK